MTNVTQEVENILELSGFHVVVSVDGDFRGTHCHGAPGEIHYVWDIEKTILCNVTSLKSNDMDGIKRTPRDAVGLAIEHVRQERGESDGKADADTGEWCDGMSSSELFNRALGWPK